MDKRDYFERIFAEGIEIAYQIDGYGSEEDRRKLIDTVDSYITQNCRRFYIDKGGIIKTPEGIATIVSRRKYKIKDGQKIYRD